MTNINKVTSLEGWSIDHQRKTVRYRGSASIRGKILQTSHHVIRDRETGKPVDYELQHRCKLKTGEIIILDETEPW